MARFRSHPARCALFGHRRDPPSSRHQAAAPAGGHRALGGYPATRCWSAACRCSSPAGGCCIRPARCCRRKTSAWSRRCLAAMPQVAGSTAACGRLAACRCPALLRLGRGAAAARECGADRWLLLCLPDSDLSATVADDVRTTMRKIRSMVPCCCTAALCCWRAAARSRRSAGPLAGDFQIRSAFVVVDHGVLQLSAHIQYPINDRIRSALQDGVTLAFDLDVTISAPPAPVVQRDACSR